LHTPQDEELDLLQNLVSDRYHRWIGTPEMASGEAESEQPELKLYPTLARLFNEFLNIKPVTGERIPRTQYPRLVAFFGDTGMGKSTIIRNLIRHLTSSKAFDVPIVGGRAEAQNSTSAGVHIYTDPETFRHERPIIYVGM
jgi:DNA helicase HerA-like ATPase